MLAVLIALATSLTGCMRDGNDLRLAIGPPASDTSSPAESLAPVSDDREPYHRELTEWTKPPSSVLAIAPEIATGTVVTSTACVATVKHAPQFQLAGLPYRQGLTQRANAPVVIPPPSTHTTVDTAALLRTQLSSIATTAEGYRTSSRLATQTGGRLINLHDAYARGATGAGVRIAIHDNPVDILHWDLRGRISFDGAMVALQQSNAYSRSGNQHRNAFRHCTSRTDAMRNGCRIWEINAGGDLQVISDFARHLIEQLGYPNHENTWWIRDTSQSLDRAWFEIPALFDKVTRQNFLGTEMYVPHDEYRHGTFVATVAAGWRYGIAPGATIVPVAIELGDRQDEVLNLNWERGLWWALYDRAPYNIPLSEIDRQRAEERLEQFSKFDIINYSHASDEGLGPDDNPFWREILLRRDAPLTWRAVQQTDIPAEDRVIEVYAAGNRTRSTPTGTALRPHEFPDFRGHHIVVAAVGEDGGIASYSNRCGGLPSDWVRDSTNSNYRGRHYCLVAPGTMRGYPQGWREGVSVPLYRVSGTSFAAPTVAGALALLMQYFTDAEGNRQLGNTEIAMRLIETADNTDYTGDGGYDYSNSAIYGAGLLDLNAATAPVGSTSMGNTRITAPARQSHASLPRAYGDIGERLRGVNIAAFDEWNAPFFHSAARFISQSPQGQRHLIPRSTAHEALAIDLVSRTLGFARAHATAPNQRIHLLANPTGLGFAWPATRQLEFGMLADTASDQGAVARGAFGSGVQSGMIWGQFTHQFQASDQWRGWLVASVGAGKPDYRDSMLHLSNSVYSSWEVGVERQPFRLSLGQPWRAESGVGSLTYTAGRRVTGEHLFAEQEFSLEPSGRELVVRAQYTTALGAGQLAVEVSGHEDFGHREHDTEGRVGLAWRVRW